MNKYIKFNWTSEQIKQLKTFKDKIYMYKLKSI